MILSLVKARGKHRVQHGRATPADLLVLIQPLLGSVQKLQRGLLVSTRYQFCNGLKPVAQVVALRTDGVLRCLHRFHPALKSGQLQGRQLCAVPCLHLPLMLVK